MYCSHLHVIDNTSLHPFVEKIIEQSLDLLYKGVMGRVVSHMEVGSFVCMYVYALACMCEQACICVCHVFGQTHVRPVCCVCVYALACAHVCMYACALACMSKPAFVCTMFLGKRTSDQFVVCVYSSLIFTHANSQVTEFQKRGLPHAHILLILDQEDKLRSPDQYDQLICAELPDKDSQPELWEVVTT